MSAASPSDHVAAHMSYDVDFAGAAQAAYSAQTVPEKPVCFETPSSDFNTSASASFLPVKMADKQKLVTWLKWVNR